MLKQFSTGTPGPTIVAVGASAGGLEAFQAFVRGLPDSHDLAVVLVQHLDPDHDSLMPELVTKRTKSPVHSVSDGMKIEPGHVYLMPPAYQMEVDGNVFRLTEFAAPRGLRRPINTFFRSLAKGDATHTIAVVLSGTGSDGTEGVKAVKQAGGVVLVQDPKEAKYDGMPRSVIEARSHDMILAAGEMVAVIRDYQDIRAGIEPAIASNGDLLPRIVRHVKYRTGHDFSEYKTGTLLRRITVRTSACGLDSPMAYLRHLVEDKDEAQRLFQDLLINVTEFFRDGEYFDTLRDTVIGRLVQEAESSGYLRIWVPGCSTGQEAYSIAMLVAEELDRRKQFTHVAVFATDIDGDALRDGRRGRYSQDIAEQVPPDLLTRYFIPRGDGYEVSPRLREMVRFSNHSFIKDPPFSKVDLVSCRNVLIYLNETAQDQAIRVFHYALRESGNLFIGPSENPKTLGDYFRELSSRARLYARLPGPAKPLNMAGNLSLSPQVANDAEPDLGTSQNESLMQSALSERHLPPHILVGRKRNVLFVSPKAIQYLSIKSGPQSADLLQMLHPEIVDPFRFVLNRDYEQARTHEREFQGTVDGTRLRFVLSAERLDDGTTLLVLHDKLQLRDALGSDVGGDEASRSYLRELEEQLDRARSEVITTVEELETSNEELKSSNEEMMSMNEELQSANEELSTINDELQDKVRALKQLNDDLNNFFASADIATVFLKTDLTLRTFSPKATDLFLFGEGDEGRPIGQFNAVIDVEALAELCAATVADKADRSVTLHSRRGDQTFRVRITPYIDNQDTVGGVAITVEDISDLTHAIAEVQHQKAVAESSLHEIEQLYSVSPQAMTLIDKDFRYLRVNPRMAEINGRPSAEHIGRTVHDIIPDVAAQTEGLISEVLKTGEAIAGRIIEGRTVHDPDTLRTWETDWYPLRRNGEIFAVGANVRDVSERIALENNLRLLMHELEHRVKNMLANVKALVSRAKAEALGDSKVYDKLVRRIEGLAKTHSLLTAERWSSAPLRAIFEPETNSIYGNDRITLRGPDIRVNARAVLGLGMVVHELATNAAKYGAMSQEGGHVSLTWMRVDRGEGERLVIEWTETGGPSVKPPKGAGFGSRLIDSTVAGSLGGTIAFNWEPTGLNAVLDLEYEHMTAIDAKRDT